jgi:hypothetical protein
VDSPPAPRKGLSKDEVLETSAMVRRWEMAAVEARTAEGNWARAQLRARVPAVCVRADMVGMAWRGVGAGFG